MNPATGPSELPPTAPNPASEPHVPIGTPPGPVTTSGISASGFESIPPMPERMLSEGDLRSPRQRRRVLPVVLFLVTCFFTYAAGAYQWSPTIFGSQIDAAQNEHWDLRATWDLLQRNWYDGVVYMGCVMAVLLAHEMGHFLMTVRYHVPASYPMFLPLPVMMTGTMGAVIGMEGFRANRRQLFDIGLAGPLAGLVITVPLVWIGIKIGDYITPQHGEIIYGDPLLTKWLIHWLRPDIPPGSELKLNPVYMAGWVGMFVTGLNMMPMSQLDGGHVIYTLFLRKSRIIARGLLLSAIGYIVITGEVTWVLMVVIVILIGVDHPPTADDRVPLGRVRTILGFLSLVLPVLCFTPFRISPA